MSIPFVTELSIDGLGVTTEMAADYSGAATENFELHGPAGESPMKVARILFFVQDGGAFDAEKWANNVTLTNGLDLHVVNADDDIVVQLTPQPIKTTGDLQALAYDVGYLSIGTGDNMIACRWTFTKFVDGGLLLDRGSKLRCVLNDDFSGLTHQRITCQGASPGDY